MRSMLSRIGCFRDIAAQHWSGSNQRRRPPVLVRAARRVALCATAAALVILWDVADQVYWWLWATP